MNNREPLLIAGLPGPLRWSGAAESAAERIPAGLRMSVAATTDLFCDPTGHAPVLSAPRLLCAAGRHFTLSAQVSVLFQTTYDAGVLVLYAHDRAWAKLCCELSPQGQPMIVSVVTNGSSDDANAVVLDQPGAYLRVTGLGAAFAFHYSLDGVAWRLVRYFTLPQPEQVQIGFLVQSPTGMSCQADFTQIRYAPESVADIRSGS